MTRAWWVAVALLLAGMGATGCGSSISATSLSTTAPKSFTGTALGWLTTEARPMNKTLNNDQAIVLRATRSGSGTNASAFFSHLAAACRQFRSDALKAQRLPPAPSAVLESDWKAMAATTEAYAYSCLTLARTHAKADLTRWNDTLKAMDSANGTLNTEVASVRGGTGRSAVG